MLPTQIAEYGGATHIRGYHIHIGQGSLELTQETRKKERKINREMAIFLNIWFWHVQLI